jgi:hypothetical protein
MRILREVAEALPTDALEMSPAKLSEPAYRIVSRQTGVADPYRPNKHETNQAALGVYPDLAKMVEAARDPLDAALHAAVAGNIIDLGIDHAFDIERDAVQLMAADFAKNSLTAFREELRPGRKLLYMGDNAGEIVFDMLLVKQIQSAGVEVTFSVKSGPIINDATVADAQEVGMTELATVIETGGANIGVDWNNVSAEFRQAFTDADIRLAKGHGNFETCNDRPERIYFLLKAKCPIVADALGVSNGDIVFTTTT